MTRKQQRITAIILVLLGAAVAAALVLFALRDNVTFFLTPTDLAQASSRPFAGGKAVRLGGLVVYGTVEKQGLVTRFVVTDLNNDIPITYHGILPDLFREGQGVVVTGTYDGTFHATQLLAKHDENYMPPEVGKMLEKNESAKQ
ncbi:MAG: cytochrome c maturation protein CcmE [Micavibrio sp.]